MAVMFFEREGGRRGRAWEKVSMILVGQVTRSEVGGIGAASGLTLKMMPLPKFDTSVKGWMVPPFLRNQERKRG